MNNNGWAIAFMLSFIPLGLWISFLLFKFGMNLSTFPWVLFAIPVVPYIGFQVRLAVLAFGERIKGEAERLRTWRKMPIRRSATKIAATAITVGKSQGKRSLRGGFFSTK